MLSKKKYLRYLFIILLLISSFSCKKERNKQNSDSQYVSYDKIFPNVDIINLEGEQLITDTVIFRVSGGQLLVKDNFLVIKTQGEPIMLFQLPEVRFLGYKGGVGNGPKEFIHPTLVSSSDEDVICYVYDDMVRSLFKLYKNEKFFSSFSPFKNEIGTRSIGDISQNKFLYANMSNASIAITEKVIEKQKVETCELLQLTLPSEPERWYCYIGNLSVNKKKDRMVFAYKYYKKIIFLKLSGEVIRVIDFPNTPGFDEKTIGVGDGLDMNVSHYSEISAGDKSVYISYSGRKPEDIRKELESNIYYGYIEQYDWDGNPEQTFKIDRFGFSTVDEKHGYIYTLSSAFDDPLFRYKFK